MGRLSPRQKNCISLECLQNVYRRVACFHGKQASPPDQAAIESAMEQVLLDVRDHRIILQEGEVEATIFKHVCERLAPPANQQSAELTTAPGNAICHNPAEVHLTGESLDPQSNSDQDTDEKVASNLSDVMAELLKHDLDLHQIVKHWLDHPNLTPTELAGWWGIPLGDMYGVAKRLESIITSRTGAKRSSRL